MKVPPRPLDHTKATARVSVTGLSLGCFNPATRNWEVALIRHPRHKLTIDVTTKFPDNHSSKMAFEVVDPSHVICIEAIEPDAPADNEVVFTQDPFDRKDLEHSHAEDFRWIVDLEREFNEGAAISIPQPQFPVTELYVAQPRLYADRKDKLDDMLLVKFEANAQAGASSSEEFGSLAQTAAADITCHPGGSVVLKIVGPMGVEVPLPHMAGVTHEIIIKNDCPEEDESEEKGRAVPVQPPSSDFKIYFDILKPQSGNKFDLKKKFSGEDGEPQGSDAVCNNTFLGGRSSLFPL